ncbi:MAG: UvrD-helicase domain-containing protein [Clostridia bacterium]|nr:UvrD-helicase domain-containing protein [Clostridia bacterium]
MASEKNSSKFTPAQERAVNSDGENVLVSAAAGSGKTHVMIERVIKLIVEGKAEVSGILALTFTNLAADGMKKKLVDAIIKQINFGDDPERFRRALSEVSTADISTFHGFCSKLLRTYFYAIGLDPTFQIAEETDTEELKNRAIERLFDDLYEEGDEDFLLLVRLFRRGRSDGALKELVRELSVFASSEARPDEFLKMAAERVNEEFFGVAEDALEVVSAHRLSGVSAELEELQRECSSFGVKRYDGVIAEMQVFISEMEKADGLDALSRLAERELPPMPRGGRIDEVTAEEGEILKAIRKSLADVCEEILSYTKDGDREERKRIFLSTLRPTAALCRLTEMFDERYSEVKRAENKVDFADLEHLTLKLLDENEDILEELKQKYKYIFADEYQDVNGVQEEILSRLSTDNLFMVGDVKQSIYAFRGCNPNIFSGKFEKFSEGEGGEAISLDANFRSADKVIAAVNAVFSRVMTKGEFGFSYSDNKMMRGGLYPEGSGSAILHIIEGAKPQKKTYRGVYNVLKDLEDKSEDSDYCEGVLIASIIDNELEKEYFDLKSGEYKRVSYGDIAVLARSSKVQSATVKQLTKFGIPVVASAGGDIRSFPEILILTNILKLITFYADDVPLATALISSLGGLNEEELAEIRRPFTQRGRKMTFLQCVNGYMSGGENEKLRQKLISFDKYFKRIRLLAEYECAGEILSRILRETGLDLEILSMPLGAMRMERVERFIAESVSGENKLSVSEFLKKVESSPINLTSSEGGGGDAVKVMSMHASKGLEFPVVIVAGLSSPFNTEDLKGSVIKDRELGIALQCRDEDANTITETSARHYFKMRSKISQVREEARVLYVAMTRAQYSLHLISSKQVRGGAAGTSIYASSFSDFLSEKDMPIMRHDRQKLISVGDREVKSVLVGKGRPSLTDKILSNISFVYPGAAATTVPVKRGVTQIVSDLSPKEAAIEDMGGGEFHGKGLAVSTDKGNAFHRFMQMRDLTSKNADNELIRLLSVGALTEEEGKLLDVERLQAVVESPLFDKFDGYKIYREQPFTAFLSAKDTALGDADCDVLVQGVIDFLAIGDEGAVIVDYKTSNKSAEKLKARYEKQLEIYALAVEKVLKVKVTGKFILNLLTAEVIEIG